MVLSRYVIIGACVLAVAVLVYFDSPTSAGNAVLTSLPPSGLITTIPPFIAWRDCTTAFCNPPEVINFTRCGNASCTSGNQTQQMPGGWPNVEFYANGLAVMAHYVEIQTGDYRLTVTQCLDTPCSQRLTSTFPSNYQATPNMGMKIGSDGFPFIVMQTSSGTGINPNLIFVHCLNVRCNQYVINQYQAPYTMRVGIDVAIGADSFPTISYNEFDAAGNGTLRVIKCLNLDCATRQINTLDAGPGIGYYSTLIIQPNGNPLVTYTEYAGSVHTVKAASCGDAMCSMNNTISTIASSAQNSDVILSSTGLPLIAYSKITPAGYSSLELTKCSDTTCSVALATYTIHAGGPSPIGSQGLNVSMSMGRNGNPVLVYMGNPGQVKFAVCTQPDCSQSTNNITIGTVHYYDNYGTAVSVDAS